MGERKKNKIQQNSVGMERKRHILKKPRFKFHLYWEIGSMDKYLQS